MQIVCLKENKHARKIRKRIKSLIVNIFERGNTMEDNKEKLKNMINDKYLNEELPEFKVTNELKEDITNHPEKYINCDVRTRMGKFRTNEEKEAYINSILDKDQMYELYVTNVINKKIKIEEIPQDLRNDMDFIKLFYRNIKSFRILNKINNLVNSIPTDNIIKLKLKTYQCLIRDNFNKNDKLLFEIENNLSKIQIDKKYHKLVTTKTITYQEIDKNHFNCKIYDIQNERKHLFSIVLKENYIKVSYKVRYTLGGYCAANKEEYYLIKNNEKFVILKPDKDNKLTFKDGIVILDYCQTEMDALNYVMVCIQANDKRRKETFVELENDLVKTKYPELPYEIINYFMIIGDIITGLIKSDDKQKYSLEDSSESLELQLSNTFKR